MTFKEILNIPPPQFADICLNFPVETFSKALVGARPELVDDFLGHFSPPIAGLIRDLIARHEDIAEWEIELARQRILAIVEASIDD